MRFAHFILRSLLVVALASYALDCEAMATPQQAMQCCAAMQCSRHGHMDSLQGMDCCKTMPTAHPQLMLPSYGYSLTHSASVFAVLPVSCDLTRSASSLRTISENNHAPPVFSPPSLLPLRI